ncbi:MAG TPA: germination protein YpeB [Bacillota bacterium]
MLRWITIGLLSLGIIGTGYWGYMEHQEKNAILIQAENTYQRAFHELSYHMDLLHDTIGTSLAMNSREKLSPQFVEIWRLTSEAQSNVGQLPLTLLPFNKTEEFLSNIGDFTYRTAVRDLDQEPLTKKEIKTLKNLYKQAGEIKDELRDVQHVVLDSNLRWMDVQLALATEDEPGDNTIIDGFKTVEKKVEGYAEANADSPLGNMSLEDHEFKNLQGEKITEKQALQLSKSLFNIENEEELNLAKSGDGSDIPLYSISYRNENKNAYMDMTQQGGYLLSLLVDRPVGKKKLSLNDGQKKSEQYLRDQSFEQMELFQSSEYGNIGVYSFLYVDDGIRMYPDAIEIKVGLDQGDILGVSAKNYFMNHHDRKLSKPKLSVKEAKKNVNPQIDLQEEHLAIIENDLGEEVLTYEFLGILDDDTYRIFINADNGQEEHVEKLGGTEKNYGKM